MDIWSASLNQPAKQCQANGYRQSKYRTNSNFRQESNLRQYVDDEAGFKTHIVISKYCLKQKKYKKKIVYNLQDAFGVF